MSIAWNVRHILKRHALFLYEFIQVSGLSKEQKAFTCEFAVFLDFEAMLIGGEFWKRF